MTFPLFDFPQNILSASQNKTTFRFLHLFMVSRHCSISDTQNPGISGLSTTIARVSITTKRQKKWKDRRQKKIKILLASHQFTFVPESHNSSSEWRESKLVLLFCNKDNKNPEGIRFVYLYWK